VTAQTAFTVQISQSHIVQVSLKAVLSYYMDGNMQWKWYAGEDMNKEPRS